MTEAIGRLAPWRRTLRRPLFVLAWGLLLVLFALDWLFPLPEQVLADASVRRVNSMQAMVVLASDGTPLRHWPGADGAMRHSVLPEDVSPLYLQALLNYEDSTFWWHPGINPLALVRAAWQWMSAGHVVSGGSTLTMQVARLMDQRCALRQHNLQACSTRTLSAKVRQMLRALQLEWHLTKREILTLYLNEAPMGGMVEGVEMAAQTYLGKSARHLSHAEAALLTALPQSPSRLRPDRYPDKAQQARDKVIERMRVLGIWSGEVVHEARMEKVFSPPARQQMLAPLMAERLRQRARHGRETVITSLIDADMQIRLEQVLFARLATLPALVSMAALIVDNADGAVRAYAGSADFHDSQRAAHVDMVRGLRSPGSTLKPFLYAQALDLGLVHAESLLIDAPQSFGGYAPGNFQSDFSGPVSVSEALQRSLNVPAVDLLDRIGPERFAAHLRQAGLRLRMPADARPNLSLILGGASTNLEELVGAYTALARQGEAIFPRLQASDPEVKTRLMSDGAAFIVREILENGGRPGAPFRETTARMAWKTGTSFGFRDAWAIGVTDGHTMGVWIGRPDGTPNPGYFGANSAAPLLRDIASVLGPQQIAPRKQPASVQAGTICWPLGRSLDETPPDQCLQSRSAWLLNGTAPPTLPERGQTQGLQIKTWVDLQRKRRVLPSCVSATDVQQTSVRWPLLLQPWILPSQQHPIERMPWAQPCSQYAGTTPDGQLKIVGLDSGSLLRPAPGQRQVRIPLQVVGSQGSLGWLLNGQLLHWAADDTPGTRKNAHTLKIQRDGNYQLTVMDDQGHHDRLKFSVQGLGQP